MIKKLLIAAALFPAASQAGELYGNVEFLNGWQLPDGSYQAAIEFDLSEGWKTYWRTPGPAGIPPAFDWSGSQNISNIEISWPTPHVFETFGLYSIGYKGKMTLPVRITPTEIDAPVNVDLNLDFGVCSDICVPASERLVTELSEATPDVGVPGIKSALTEAPASAKSGGIRAASCALTPNGTGFDIRADLKFANTVGGTPLTVIEYADPDIWIDLAETSANGKDLTATATLEYYGDAMLLVDRSAIRITVLNDDKAVEVLGCPAKG